LRLGSLDVVIGRAFDPSALGRWFDTCCSPR